LRNARARTGAAAALAAAVLLAAGCFTRPVELPELGLPDIHDGERSVYEVTRNDTVLYRTAITLNFDEELSDPAGAGEAVPMIVVTSSVEPVGPDVFFFDSSVVVSRRDSFSPVRSYRSIETDVSELEIDARYTDRHAAITKRTVEGVVEDAVKLPRPAFVVDVLQTFLRAVPPVSGTSFSVAMVVPIEFRTVPVKVSVLGTKLVTTDLGDILCREIVASTPNREVRFLYELEQPRRFVEMRDVSNETAMLLVGYERGAPDSLPPVP
jgi:hypothetical protein